MIVSIPDFQVFNVILYRMLQTTVFTETIKKKILPFEIMKLEILFSKIG